MNFQTRGGISVQTNNLKAFWTSTNTDLGENSFVVDPRVCFIPYDNRWVACAVVDPDLGTSGILVGVSQTGNPTNGWYLRRVKADTASAVWADYPRLGFNKDWIVVAANMFDYTTNGEAYVRTHIFVFSKTNLYAGGTNAPTLLLHTNSATAGNEMPAWTYDDSVSTLYLLQIANGNTNGQGYLRLFSITGATGSEVLNNVTNPTYIVSPEPWADRTDRTNRFSFYPQSGTSNGIGTLPESRLSDVVYRNGSLWAAHTIFLPLTNTTRTAVQWWQINPASPQVLQRGRIDDNSGVNSYGFPSIAVNRFSDVLIGYNAFSTNYHPSAAYSLRDYYENPNQIRPPRIYWAGEGIFAPSSLYWGDYSASSIDPLNDVDLWTIQQYAAPVDEVGDGRWGTRWAQVTLVVPTNDNFSSALAITGTLGTTNATNYRATKESSEPSHAGNAGGASIWYNWTAPQSGQVSFDTVGSTFNTLLAVYTGTSVSSLTLITNNDDYGGVLTSLVLFNATSNTTYRIAVDGYLGETGEGILNWCQPLAPVILGQPQGTNVVANANENANFSLLACGALPLEYRWRFQGTNSNDPTNQISGATNSSYTISNVQGTNAGYYSAIVSNGFGSLTSVVVTLFVHGDSAARLNSIGITSTSFWFNTFGLTNRGYRLEWSEDMTNWHALWTNNVSFFHTNNFGDTTNFMRFYRAITNN